PGTHMGTVSLTVSDLGRVASFYERVLGLRPRPEDDGRVSLHADAGRALVELRADSGAPVRDPRAPGLFHLALLLPDRRELAMALARLGANRWPLDGASDHLVSEALYLSDPEGNGIELYRDRPRAEWPESDGSLAMATLPLDLENLLAELGDASSVEPRAPAGTTMGHVHLKVSDIQQAEDFYVGVLGFEVTVRRYPGALFVSAGGYHHHLCLNTWHSAGSPPAPPEAAGLRNFEVVLPSADELDKVVARVQKAGLQIEPDAGGQFVRDPFGNGVLLRAA
ncbi:MAG: VOC family protein, partial [Streptosporangiaceae bacterium]